MKNQTPGPVPILIVSEYEQLRKIIKEEVGLAFKNQVPDMIKKANEKDFLTCAELQELLGRSSRNLQHLRDTRQIAFVKHGRKIVYPRAGIEKFIQDHHVLPRENKKGVKP